MRRLLVRAALALSILVLIFIYSITPTAVSAPAKQRQHLHNILSIATPPDATSTVKSGLEPAALSRATADAPDVAADATPPLTVQGPLGTDPGL